MNEIPTPLQEAQVKALSDKLANEGLERGDLELVRIDDKGQNVYRRKQTTAVKLTKMMCDWGTVRVLETMADVLDTELAKAKNPSEARVNSDQRAAKALRSCTQQIRSGK